MKVNFFRELDLSQIKAKGWAAEFIKTQIKGMTGNIGKTGEPFSGDYWGSNKSTYEDYGVFLGGMEESDMGLWVPFEQTGYWIDGMVKCGNLVDDKEFLKLPESKIIPTIENADKDGYLGPQFLKNGMVWAHSVYFRSLIAQYTATHDERILEALKKHFLRIPLKGILERYKGVRIMAVRNIADIETALWIYWKTKDKRFLDMAQESYDLFNEIFVDDSNAEPHAQTKDVTVKGMLGNRKVNRNHGVTYCEICKLSAIMYLYTKKEKYKKAAIKAFDKVYRDQMLVDGVISSTEYLNGNGNSHCSHETCDVSDFTWALGYLYMITGDPKYGDWIEDAIFNGGFGCVDDDFKGNQYFSCPNQVLSTDTSNHLPFYRGSDWMSYAPGKFLGCCAGNVNRFMPNFIYRSVMVGDDNKIAFMTYVPCEVNLNINNTSVKITEQTNYPFENSVKFVVSCNKPTELCLVLRKPCWASDCKLNIGKNLTYIQKGNQYFVSGVFNQEERIDISFSDSIALIYNAKGVSVKKGALLYALPIKEKVVNEGLREKGFEGLPRYSLYPLSSWNYALDDKNPQFEFLNDGKVGNKPWTRNGNHFVIKANAFICPSWKLKTFKDGHRRVSPRAKASCLIGHPFSITPVVSQKMKIEDGEVKRIELVPYCTTRLRISIFPYKK